MKLFSGYTKQQRQSQQVTIIDLLNAIDRNDTDKTQCIIAECDFDLNKEYLGRAFKRKVNLFLK